MVRLKDTGGIAVKRCYVCFNSTMVRLKAYDTDGSVLTIVSFNSTMVRLKAHCLADVLDKFYRFNSTMVRLKAGGGGGGVTGAEKFQFHYGSIKGWHRGFNCYSHNAVSIPLWFD